ncbi:glycolate oxidase subunit GlcE [Rhodocyclaceae bacterium SMB388]
MKELIESCQARIRDAAAAGAVLRIRGGGTKDFYGGIAQGELFDTRALAGVVSYEPSELVVTVLAGTPLTELERLLAAQGQMLAFEPPHFGDGATIGGTVATGLSGPRRPMAGALRDYVLGTRIIDGRGDLLAFGGQVMKNVAGYDVSRLIAGSLGTLGLIVDVSLKVLPIPPSERSLRFPVPEADAIDMLNRWGGQPLPVSASAWHQGQLTVRLSGAPDAVGSAATRMGGQPVPDDEATAFWRGIREQSDGFFAPEDDPALVLWRISVPTAAAPLGLDGPQLIEWGGGLRWLRSSAPSTAIRARAAALGGTATMFRGGDRGAGVFHPLSPAVMEIHRRLKQSFDPAGIFNPGRLYNGF